MGDLFKWMIVLALVAAVAGFLGFGGVARLAGAGAKILLVIFLIGIVVMGLILYALFAVVS